MVRRTRRQGRDGRGRDRQDGRGRHHPLQGRVQERDGSGQREAHPPHPQRHQRHHRRPGQAAPLLRQPGRGEHGRLRPADHDQEREVRLAELKAKTEERNSSAAGSTGFPASAAKPAPVIPAANDKNYVF